MGGPTPMCGFVMEKRQTSRGIGKLSRVFD